MHLDRGVYPAVLTPLHSDLTVHEEELFHHCQDLLSRGAKGLLIFGTTGEGNSFTNKERISTIQYLIKKGIDPDKILLSNSSSNIFDTIELSLFVCKTQLKALLIAPPCYYKNVSDAGVIAFYKEILDRVDDPRLPVLLYHIPQCTSVPLNVSIIKAVAEAFPKNVVGIKDSGGDAEFTKSLVKHFPSLQIFATESLIPGIFGTISGLANLYLEPLVIAHRDQNPAAIAHLVGIEKHWHGLSYIAAFKALMEKKRGTSWSHCRPPLQPLTLKQKETIKTL